jgi:hypothetical protein
MWNGLPTIYAFSPLLFPRPFDWPNCHHVTGFLDPLACQSNSASVSPSASVSSSDSESSNQVHIPAGTGAPKLSQRMEEFLLKSREEGYKVICVNFGSITVLDKVGVMLVRRCVEAARLLRTGLRIRCVLLGSAAHEEVLFRDGQVSREMVYFEVRT